MLEFFEVWDFLLVKLFLLVGLWFGLLENVNLEDYYFVKESGENKIMFVLKYKRLKVGLVFFGMDKEL